MWAIQPVMTFFTWYVKNECIRVFCNKKKKQVAILHSDYSEEFEECQEALPNFKHEVTVKDKDGMIHLHAQPNIDKSIVDWDILQMNIFANDHVW